MSTTHSETAVGTADAAVVVAAALRDVAARTAGIRRVYLPRFIGLSPADVFAALEPDFGPAPAVGVETPNGHIALLGIATGGAVLIPYLVTPVGDAVEALAKPNRGSAGFAARLRDEIRPGSGAPAMLLVVLDPDPVETVRTAAEDARDLPQLEWGSLVERASSMLAALPPLSRAVIDDIVTRDRLPHDAKHLGVLLQLLREARTDTELGTQLHRLGCYLSDPAAGADPATRLRLGHAWRERLDRWSAPGEDLAERLTAVYGDPDAAGRQAILAAETAFGVDFSAFTLDDLPEARPRDRLAISRPVRVRGAAAVAGRGGAAIWLPGGGTFAVLLRGTPGRADAATISWHDGAASDAAIDAGRRELRVSCNATADWVYGRLALGQGDTLNLAVYTGQGSWFPAEASIDIDPAAGCFRYAGEPRVMAVGATGAVVSAPTIQPAGAVEPGEPADYAAAYAGERHPIALLDTGEVGIDVPADPGEDDEPDPGDGDGGPVPPICGPPGIRISDSFPSVPHAKLAVARARLDADLGAVTFGVAEGQGYIGVGGALPRLSPQPLSIAGLPTDGLDLEQRVLGQPDSTAYAARFEAGELRLEPDPLLEGLALDDLGADRLDAFWGARRDLFLALQPHGSVHAIAAGVARREAARYVEAYAQLMEVAASGGPFRAEYERLILCDAITDIASGEILLAPTNPVTVEFMLRLDAAVNSWLPRAAEVLDADLSDCSVRYLLPTFALRGSWYESVGGAPLPWRRYMQLPSSGSGGESDPGYVTRRLHHFLDVFPAYADERQTLAVSFIEPGDGGVVLAALRSFYEPLARVHGVGDTAHLPSLDVTVVASTRPEKLERAISAADEIIDTVLRDRVAVTLAGPGERRPEFAHLTFIFRSPLHREPATVELSSRASTLYVGGLASAPGRHTTHGRNETQFAWGAFAGRVPRPADSLEGLVRASLELVGGMPRDQVVPDHTRMPTTRVSTGFLTEIYTRSVWVVHLDRLLGLEAFAPSATGERARYLIDYEGRAEPGQHGLDAITATERVEPYHLSLGKVLKEIGHPRPAALDRILSRLNSVSGRWAIDLVGAGSLRIRERIGIVAAIAAVHELDGAFADTEESLTVMLALDEVLDALPAGSRNRPLGQHCDDLLVLTLPLASGPVRISGRLIEVKYRSITDPDLPAIARPQLEAARDWLLSKFNTDGPARPFRARDLSELIRGAIARAEAFGLRKRASESTVKEAEDALERISRGEFYLDLGFDVDARRFHGEFVSVEAESGFAAHRQALPGTGQPLSWLRLGRPVLEALAAARSLPRPSAFQRATVPSRTFPGEQGESGGQASAPPPGGPGTNGNSSRQEPARASAEQAAETKAAGATGARPAAAQVESSTEPETIRVAAELTEAAGKYGMDVEPFDPALAEVGPSVIRLRTRLLGRQTLAGIQSRALDLGREVGVAEGLLINQEPYYVTVDVPRAERETVLYGDYAQLLDAPAEPGALNFLLGVAPSGTVRIADLARLPHLLVAGATGSGKSVFLRGLVSSLVRARNPVGLQLLVCDPQTINYEPLEGSLHLVEGRIITDPLEMVEQLTDTLARELERRRARLREARVTSALEFYEEGGSVDELQQMVIIIDEFADLVDALQRDARATFMQNVKRFAQMTRALGIYLVLATQRPSVQIITGDIKANLTARVALRMQASQDSITILGRGGAETLRDKGDLLFDHNGRLERLQGLLCTPRDAVAEVNRWRAPEFS